MVDPCIIDTFSQVYLGSAVVAPWQQKLPLPRGTTAWSPSSFSSWAFWFGVVGMPRKGWNGHSNSEEVGTLEIIGGSNLQ